MHAPPTNFLTIAASDRHADTRTAALSVAATLRETLPGPPQAVLVIASFHHAAVVPEAVRTIRESLDVPATVGFTARSLMEGSEEFDRGPALAAMAITGPEMRARAFRFDHRDGPPEAWSRELVRSRLRPMSPPRGVMVFGDPFSTGSNALPSRLADAVLPDVPVCGGLLSGASQAGANVLVADDHVSNSGAVGLVFEGDVEVESVISHGARGVGPTFVVTKADATGISELSGRPAATVLDDLLAELSAQDRTTLGRTPLIGLAIDAAKSPQGRGDFLIRPIAAVDRSSGTLLTTGRVRRGSTIQFQVRDAAIAADDLDMSLDLAILDDRPPAGILLAGSAGRGASLFGASGHDSGRIHERLGEPPLIGFEAAAEIASFGGQPRIAGLGLSAMILRGRDMRRNPSDADR